MYFFKHLLPYQERVYWTCSLVVWFSRHCRHSTPSHLKCIGIMLLWSFIISEGSISIYLFFPDTDHFLFLVISWLLLAGVCHFNGFFHLKKKKKKTYWFSSFSVPQVVFYIINFCSYLLYFLPSISFEFNLLLFNFLVSIHKTVFLSLSFLIYI